MAKSISGSPPVDTKRDTTNRIILTMLSVFLIGIGLYIIWIGYRETESINREVLSIGENLGLSGTTSVSELLLIQLRTRVAYNQIVGGVVLLASGGFFALLMFVNKSIRRLQSTIHSQHNEIQQLREHKATSHETR